MKPKLLVRVDRGNFPERFHYGFISVIDEDYNHVLKLGEDDNISFPFRSAAKPLQASALIDSGTAGHFGFSSKELAIICSSHAGSARHVKVVEGLLEKIGLTAENLQCGAHKPLDKEEKIRLIRENKTPTSIHNNCSGKHAGMLAICVKNNWDIDTYLDREHPLPKQILAKIKDLCQLKELPETVNDGCSALISVLPYYNMGIGFLNFFSTSKYSPLKSAMIENPYTIGGNGRIDSEIIAASGGELIAKVGAEGLCMVINLKEKKVLIVKIVDGDMKIRSVVIIEMLKKLEWLKEEQIINSQGLNPLYEKKLRNFKQKVTSEIKILF